MDFEHTQPSLLSRVRNPQDQAAWHQFETKYRELIGRYCRRRGLQAADVDDVRQIVMLDLARGLRDFEYDPARGRFRHYLGRVVRSAIFRHFRRPNPAQAALVSTVLAALPGEDEAAADELWEEEWVQHHYRLALETIRRTYEPRSIAVFDRLVAGNAVETVAAEFELSAQAVHKIKQRIRDRMQVLIQEQIRAEDDPDGVQQSRSDDPERST